MKSINLKAAVAAMLLFAPTLAAYAHPVAVSRVRVIVPHDRGSRPHGHASIAHH